MKRRLKTQVIPGMMIALLAGVVLAAGETPQPPPAAPDDADRDGAFQDTTVGLAGLRVRLDPRTGEISSASPESGSELEAGAGVPSAIARLNTYGGDLLEERLPNGAVRVDLRGRFQSAVVATIDPESDAVSIDCVSVPADGEAANDE
jgi:hypothetical protein